MKVTVARWRNGMRVTDLSDVLTPSASAYEYSGSMEETAGVGRKTAEAFGRLAELLVEKGVISLEEALAAAGVHDSVEAVEG